ncbi:MAG: endonuclease [Paludibacteraceae bacterium]|nr:endonuclease [Paludibacteraceae bacterium]
MKKYYNIFLLLVVSHAICATEPANYYSAVNGQSGAAILQALYNTISSHTNVGYDGLYSVYPTSDVRPGTNKVWDMYSTCTFIHGQKKCGTYSSVCDCYNREHSVPQSWFGEAQPMKSDAFHVIPTDGKVNGQRSNYPLGECANGSYLNSQSLGRLGTSTFSGYSGLVFEVDDEYKGDFARAYFYMVACYYDRNFTMSNGSTVFTYSNGHAGLTTYAINLFMKWHRQDPVSQKELDRNEAIYAKQHNRNPFIDHPCLAEYIWGCFKGDAVYLTSLDQCNCDVQPDTTQHDTTVVSGFHIEPATDIHSTSAILHWTSANVSNYTVDVYQKSESGVEEELILSDSEGALATCSGYTDTQTSGWIRLGSGKTNGQLTYTGLDLSQGGTVYVTARQYSNDNGAPMKVTVGSTTQTFTTAVVADTYILNVPPQSGTSSTLVIENTTKGERIYVSIVEVYAGGITTLISHVNGYPQAVGNVLQHQVTGLEGNQLYFYTVTPAGMASSEEGIFQTEAGWTGWEFVPFPDWEYRMTSTGVQLMGIPFGADLRIWDTTGRLLLQVIGCSDETMECPLAEGLNLIELRQGSTSQVIKLIH